jgi:hypothetical protein
MAIDDPAVLARLTPQPNNFDAPVRVDQLHSAACDQIARSPGREAFVRELAGLDVSNLTGPDDANAICLAAWAALQRCVEDGSIEPCIFPPEGARFFRLPPDALFTAGPVSDPFGEDRERTYPWHLADTAWRTGQLGLQDGSLALAPLSERKLPVFVSRTHEKNALTLIDRLLAEGAARGLVRLDQPDSDEAVDQTIRRLSDERGGRLPLNVGAILVIEDHPTRRRDEVRDRIRAIQGPQRPGPTGPRNRAAKKN